MGVRVHLRLIDVERMIVVPAISLLLIVAEYNLIFGRKEHFDSLTSLIAILTYCYQILLTLFYIMMIVLLFIRGEKQARNERITPKLAAYLGTFLPLLFTFAGNSDVPIGLAILALTLMTAGMTFAVYSMFVLGRSFGIEPQVRRLVRQGPYRFVRHPLYIGEMAAMVGTVCFSPTILKVTILLVECAIQTYRAVQEERLFECSIPEYSTYKQQTKRFVPGLF